MNWFAHFAIGFLLSALIFHFLGTNPYELAILSIFAGASALLPDLDHTNSKARQMLDKVIIFIAAIFTYLFHCSNYSCILTENFALRIFAFAGAYFLVFTYFKPEHRGITHSLLLCVFFALLVYFILGTSFAIAGALGYLSHLLADKEIKLI